MKLSVPKFLAKTSAKIDVTNGTNENGEANVESSFEQAGRFEQVNRVIYSTGGQKVSLTGEFFLFDNFDNYPDNMQGFCTVFGNRYDIAACTKERNPDGTVNHIVLELM